jgi:IS30 family transposase
LLLSEREEISRGLARDVSLRSVAGRLGGSPSTVSREVEINGGHGWYRATVAHWALRRRAKRPKTTKLAECPWLPNAVEGKLELWWSRSQISRWLMRAYRDDEEMLVSHETIYQSLFVQARGTLRKELWRSLCTRRAVRRPQGRPKSTKGQIRDMVMISERPGEVEDRAVPGHWEGDLIIGTGKSAIGTLVERHTRYVMLFKVPKGNKAEDVRVAMTDTIKELPEHLFKSLTWDQGKEMARHTAPLPSIPVSRFTSVTRSRRGSEDQTRTPTGCYASTSRKAPTSPKSHRVTSTTPPTPSTQDLDKPSAT